MADLQETILVVDDEDEIADLVELYLKNENYHVEKCHNAQDAYTCMKSIDIDMAILDVMLPDEDGISICKRIREKYKFPVIMLTSKTENIDKINGLTVGADDYITKPFHPLELVARVKSQLRRYRIYNTGNQGESYLEYDNLAINLNARECTVDGKLIQLTPTEFSILWILFRRKGEAVASEELFHEIWGEEYYSKSTNPIPVHVRHIREKLNDSVDKPRYIQTVWGVGYKVEN